MVKGWCSFLVFFAVTAGAEEPCNVKIGFIAPLSGEFQSLGVGLKNAAQLAVDEFNSSANTSCRVQLIAENDEFDPKKGVAAYQKLVNIDQIAALFNVSTPTIGAIAPNVAKAGMPVIQLGFEPGAPEVDTIFQIQGEPSDAGAALGEHLRKRSVGEVVVVAVEEPALEGMLSGFHQQLGRKSVVHRVRGEERDFRTLVAKVVREKPARLVFALYPNQGALFIRTFASQKPRDIRLVSLFTLDVGLDEYKSLLGSLDPLMSVESVVAARGDIRSFKQRYSQRFGAPPSYSEYAYDALRVLMSTYVPASDKWLDQIQAFDGMGVSGRISFSKEGIRKTEFEIKTVAEILAAETAG